MMSCIRMASSRVTDLAYSFTAPDTSTVTFNMTKDGAPYDGTKADSLGIYFAPYDGEKFQFEPALERMSLKGDLTYDGAGGVTSVMAGTTDLSAVNGLVVVYGTDEIVGTIACSHPAGQVSVCRAARNGRRRRLRFCRQRRRLREVPHRSLPEAWLHLCPGQRRSRHRLLHLQGLPPGQRRGRPLRMAAARSTIRRWRLRSSPAKSS